jgi:hypothetical protein
MERDWSLQVNTTHVLLHPIYLRFILILSSHVGLFLTSGPIRSGFLLTKILYEFLCFVYTIFLLGRQPWSIDMKL